MVIKEQEEGEEKRKNGRDIMKWQSQNLFIAIMNDKIFIIVF